MGWLRGTKTLSTTCEPGRRVPDAGHPALLLRGDLEGWAGEAGAAGSGCGAHVSAHGRLMLTYGKSHHTIVKLLSKNQRETLRAREHYFSRTDTRKQD